MRSKTAKILRKYVNIVGVGDSRPNATTYNPMKDIKQQFKKLNKSQKTQFIKIAKMAIQQESN